MPILSQGAAPRRIGHLTVPISWPMSLDYLNRPGQLPPDVAAELADFISTEEGLIVRDGFSRLGSAALDNIPLRLARFEQEDGDIFTIAHTKTKCYYLSGGVWADISRAAQYTGTDANLYDSTVVPTGLSTVPSDYVFTNYADKIQFWDGVVATALDIAAVLAIQTAAPTGAFPGAAGLTGAYRYWTTEYDALSGVESANNNATLLMNPLNQTVRLTKPATVNSRATHWRPYRSIAGGAYPVGYRLVDVPIATATYDDALADGPLILLPLYSSTSVLHALENVRAKYCTYFAGRLFIADLIEESPNKIRALRMRWSREGGYRHTDDWTGLGSGFADLAETPDEISGMAKLGSQLVIYKRRSIIHAIETGDILQPFQFEWRTIADLDKGNGLVAHQTLANLSGFHIGLGSDNLYRYDGQLRPIGDAVIRDIVRQAGIPNLFRAFAFVDPIRSWYVIFVPLAGQTWPEQGHIYDYRRDLWVGRMNRKASAAGMLQPTATTLWQDVDQQWSDIEAAWGSFGLETALPIPTLASPDDKKVYQYDSTVDYDGTGAIWRTGDLDLGFPDDEKTLIRVRVRVDDGGTAQPLTLSISVNSGKSFTQIVAKNTKGVSGESDVFFDTRVTAVRFTLQFTTMKRIRIVEWAPMFQIRGRSK